MEIIGFIKALRKKNIVYYNVWMPIIMNFEVTQTEREVKIPSFLKFKRNTYYRAISYGLEIFPEFVTEYSLDKKKGFLILKKIIDSDDSNEGSAKNKNRKNNSKDKAEFYEEKSKLQDDVLNRVHHAEIIQSDSRINSETNSKDAFSSKDNDNNGFVVFDVEPEPKSQKKNNAKKLAGKHSDEVYEQIISYLNLATGKEFRPTTKAYRMLIDARLREGYKIVDFKKVIDTKTMKWLNTVHQDYLRPETLFSGKFEAYLNENVAISGLNNNNQNNRKSNFTAIHEQLSIVQQLRDSSEG